MPNSPDYVTNVLLVLISQEVPEKDTVNQKKPVPLTAETATRKPVSVSPVTLTES